jgi:hypothetical protein
MNEMKELKDTIGLMLSDDFKDRLVAEYWQVKIRHAKLSSYRTKRLNDTDTPVYELLMLSDQLSGMEMYMNALEARACSLDIDFDNYNK